MADSPYTIINHHCISGAKATAMVNLVKSLKAAGVPVDGIGLQCHFIVGEVPTSLATVMAQFTALGVEVRLLYVTWCTSFC